VTGNGQVPVHQEVDHQRLAMDLAQQVGALTAEVMARGQIIDRLRAELAEALGRVTEGAHVAGE
jgi:hypothetical protein